MQIAKTAHCATCPAYQAPGRCATTGSQVADVVFVTGAPRPGVEARDFNVFSDYSSSFFLKVLDGEKAKQPAFKNLDYSYIHAVQCVVEKEEADVIKHCRQIVHKQIALTGCKVVVLLGVTAMRSFGMTQSMNDVRGKVLSMTVAGHPVKVVTTYNPGMFLKDNAGLLSTFKADLRRAMQCAMGNTKIGTDLRDLTKGYQLCTTIATARDAIDEALAARSVDTGKPVILSVDTETTGLKTWLPDFRIIALSFAWGEGKAAAILLNHVAMQEDWRELIPDVKRLLESPNPKVGHNWQYDLKVLELALGWEVKNISWDTMLVEYLLDESKQGHYGLKNVVRNRVPEFTDYEKSLKSQLDEGLYALTNRGKEVALEIEKVQEKIKQKDAQRKVADKVQKKILQGEISFLRTAVAAAKDGLRTIKGEMAKEAAAPKTFEDVKVEDMLLYAAIDADCTRRICGQQARDMKSEDEMMALRYTLNTVMLPSVRVLARMEHEGVLIDQAHLEYLEKEFRQIMVETEAKVYALAGHPFNINSGQQLAKVLVMEQGLTISKRTATGQIAVDKTVLEELAKTNPLAKQVFVYRKAFKAVDTVLKGIREAIVSDGRVHCSYHLTGTSTGRLCLAEGTPIEVVRDVSKYPKGVPIEDVRPGDYAYCYDANLQLRLRKVIWQGKTGHKRVIRVHWLGQGRKHKGYLDLTPEHQVRLSDGSYVQAKNLKPNDSLLALGRSMTMGYSRLHTRDTEVRDHRFIYSEVLGSCSEHVHHVDGNKANNCLSNLEGLSATEHKRRHALEMAKDPRIKKARSESTKRRWEEGRMPVRYGEECHNYVSTTKFQLLRQLAVSAGRPTRCKGIVTDFQTFKDKCLDHGIDIASVGKRYNAKNEFLSRGNLRRALSLRDPETYKSLSIGYYRFQELCQYYGLSRAKLYGGVYNHIVTRVEDLATEVAVYDLEIEDCHNFIANEICVHNSSSAPNMQNQPSEILGLNIKKLFIPDSDDEVFVNMDYSGAEIRVLCAYADDQALKDSLNRGLNTHSYVASKIFALSYDEIENRNEIKKTDPARAKFLNSKRQAAKSTVFLTIYGGGATKLHENLVKADASLTVADCEKIITSFLDEFPVIRTYMDRIRFEVRTKAYVQTYFGRRRRFPMASLDWKALNAACREAINFPIQGTSSDLVMVQLVEMAKEGAAIGFKPRITVHDSIAGSVPKASIPLLRAFLDKYATARITEKFGKWMPVPMEYEADYGPSYGEGIHEIKK